MAASRSKNLRSKLRSYGITDEAIDLAWPSWWSDDAEDSSSAAAELRFSVARRLGLDARKLLQNDEPVFVWKVGKFKNLRNAGGKEEAIISFCTSIARTASSAMHSSPHPVPAADALRSAMLSSKPYIELGDLITTCWALGVPVFCLRVSLLEAKRMHAMAVRVRDRSAILIAREINFPAQAAFDIAHELGHIALGHLDNGDVVADFDDPLKSNDHDPEEEAANRYALELLTGTADPMVLPSQDDFIARDLANSAMRAAPSLGIDAGTLVLCLGHQTQRWPQVTAALKHLYGGTLPVGDEINRVAIKQLRQGDLSAENEEFLLAVMGLV